MKTVKLIAAATGLAILLAFVPIAAPALSFPRTLAHVETLGRVGATPETVHPPFSIDYLGVSWTSGSEPAVRFQQGGRWTSWHTAHEDDVPTLDGRTFSSLIPGGDAEVFQVRGANDGVRATAINTTDGPRSPTIATAPAHASHLPQPPVVSRTGWGADESYRFNEDGTEKWPPAFYVTEKLIVHHTDTRNDDPDPASTVRAIYRYHAIDKGWGDIGYNFLVDAGGQIYKGRYSGPAGTRYEDTATGENSLGQGVTAAHTSGWNSGTMGIAVLGNYVSTAVPAAARTAVVDHLAWEAERHSLDPLAGSSFTNPVSGEVKSNENISGHRDWTATECPGDTFYADLPAIRQDVHTKLSSGQEPVPSKSYAPQSVTILAGTGAGDPVANLSGDDAAYHKVDSVRSGSKEIADWYAAASIDVSGVTRLTATYDGSYSKTATQTLKVFNFSAGSWEDFSLASVSTSDQTFMWSTTTPGDYISSLGEVRLRMSAERSKRSFTARGDLVRFSAEY